MRFSSARAARLIALSAIVGVLALSVAGCKTSGNDVTGSVGSSAVPRSEAEARGSLDELGARYRQNPDDPQAALKFAQALRATEQRAQAVAVLERTAIRHPNDMAVLGAYGRALAEAGDYSQALDVLTRAHTPDNPDWRILNAQGAVLDQLGRHAEAQSHYSSALKIVPNEPSILSNQGLSYVLTKDLKRAEATLRKAIAQPGANQKARQNLALVVGLQGRFAEAERIARADLPEAEAADNVRYLREMLSQQNQMKRTGQRPYLPPIDAGG